MELLYNGFHSPAQPGEPCVSPACSDVQHKNVLLANAFNEAMEGVVPEKDLILERQCHGCAFIGKTTMLRFNSTQTLCQRALIAILKGGVISLKKDATYIFHSMPDFRARAGKSPPGE